MIGVETVKLAASTKCVMTRTPEVAKETRLMRTAGAPDGGGVVLGGVGEELVSVGDVLEGVGEVLVGEVLGGAPDVVELGADAAAALSAATSDE